MSCNSEEEIFGYMKIYRRGRRTQEVIVGDHPDVRIARFRRGTQIIKVGCGKICDGSYQTADGKRWYIYPKNNLTEDFLRKQIAKDKILNWTKGASDEDVITLSQLMAERTRRNLGYRSRYLAEMLIRECAEGPALGVRELEEFADLVVPNGSQDLTFIQKGGPNTMSNRSEWTYKWAISSSRFPAMTSVCNS